MGKDPFAIEAILQDLDASLVGAYQAKGAIDCALHDLKARVLGVPLFKLLGGKVRDKVPVLRILALKTPEETAGIAAKLFEQGYRYFKIKVHGDVAEDVARVKAIRDTPRLGGASYHRRQSVLQRQGRDPCDQPHGGIWT